MDKTKKYAKRAAVNWQKRLSGKAAGWWYAVAVAVPFLALVVMVAIFGVNVPFFDQWELVSLFEKYHDGQLAFSDFFAQHNEHRLLFPRLVMFVLAEASSWNIQLEMFASVLLAGAALFFLYKTLAYTIRNKMLRWLALASISIIFFSPIQWENWLWGWQIQWYLNILGLIVAVWALGVWQASPLKRIVVATFAAIVATYSLASGFFVWVVCVPLLWFVPSLRRWLWLWLVLAAAAIGSHYIGYQDPMYSPSRMLFLDAPFAFAKYVATYLAHPITVESVHTKFTAVFYAAVFGGALVIIFKKARHLLRAELLPWFILALYACCAAASTGVSRLGLGVEQAYSSRYVTISQFLLITLVVLLYILIEHKLARRFAMVALIIIVSLVLLNYAKGIIQMDKQSKILRSARQCAMQAQSKEDECLLKLYPSKGHVWPRLEYLRSIHWSGL